MLSVSTFAHLNLNYGLSTYMNLCLNHSQLLLLRTSRESTLHFQYRYLKEIIIIYSIVDGFLWSRTSRIDFSEIKTILKISGKSLLIQILTVLAGLAIYRQIRDFGLHLGDGKFGLAINRQSPKVRDFEPQNWRNWRNMKNSGYFGDFR